MDAPRRWQIASVTTAVAGLGVGALLLGRPATTSVPPIDLELVHTADRGADRGADQGPDGAPAAPAVRPDPDASDDDGEDREDGDVGGDARREVVIPDADAIDREASANSPADAEVDDAPVAPATTRSTGGATNTDGASAGDSVDSVDDDASNDS